VVEALRLHAADNAGNLYFVTGNGTFESNLNANGFPSKSDYGDTLLKLAVDPSSDATHQNPNGWGLKVVDYFAPHNQAELASLDLDLGSGAPLLLPDAAGSAAHPRLSTKLPGIVVVAAVSSVLIRPAASRSSA
jgi:hypothetical protein